MEHGVNPNSQSDFDPIILKMAELGLLEFIKLYQFYGGNLHFRNRENWNAIHFAVSREHLEITKYLISKGVEFDSNSESGKKILSLASQFRSNKKNNNDNNSENFENEFIEVLKRNTPKPPYIGSDGKPVPLDNLKPVDGNLFEVCSFSCFLK